MPTANRGETNTFSSDPTLQRSLGEDAVPAPGHSRNGVPEDYRTIPGWGVDADRASRGGVPGELPSTSKSLRGDVKHWQVPRSKIHISNEQPGGAELEYDRELDRTRSTVMKAAVVFGAVLIGAELWRRRG